MQVFNFMIVLTANLKVVFSDCGLMPSDIHKQQRPLDCCLIPPFFTEEDLEMCGFNNNNFGHRLHGHIPWSKPAQGVDRCARQNCVLDHYGLRKDGKLDVTATGEFLDKWVETHQDYFYLIGVAKDKCLLDIDGGYCLFDKVAVCISHVIYEECPQWSNTDYCLALKDWRDYCKNDN